MFSKEIKKIVWDWKLSPDTINIPTSDNVQEIQVLTLSLKDSHLNTKLLQTIDRAVPSPILFQIVHEKKKRYTAAYKRPGKKSSRKWVVGNYFETEWMKENAEKRELPVVLNMEALYRTLLDNIILIPSKKSESLEDWMVRVESIRTHEKR